MYHLDKILYIRFGFQHPIQTIKIHFTFLVLLPVCDVVKSSAQRAAAAAARPRPDHGRSPWPRALLSCLLPSPHSRAGSPQPSGSYKIGE